MPVETRVIAQFGDKIREIMGEDTFGQAAIKTGISKAYLLAMGRGQVPTRAIVEKFAAGYNTEPKELLVVAGYERPSDPDPARGVCPGRTRPP